ncbi:unnamed protein product [Linum tenue]|uniref:FAE domain-containing protein n=1 Tax=Linum tenue TaxID=586396 RepID=A0AAV0KF75_9ROSI|nr:unnamed protein product [Linum tenue]
MVFEGREENPTLRDGLLEMDEFFHDTIGKLLARSGVKPDEIDLLVVNVSMLAAVPSPTSRIVNHYKMRDDIRTFDLTGMGCSASLISVGIMSNTTGGKDDSYACCIQKEDGQGRLGFHLVKNLPKAATRVFADNLREISPKILPVRELVRFVAVYSMRKLKTSRPDLGRRGGSRW